MGLNISGSLTRQAWLAGISQGNDLRTDATFPAVAAQPQFQGLGGFGGQHGTADPGGAVLAPIVELRRMAKSISPHDFTEIAMGVYDFVVALNAAGPGGAMPAYARTALPAKTVKNRQRPTSAIRSRPPGPRRVRSQYGCRR